MAALTCTDTAPSGSHARSRRGRVVGHAPYIRGARRADLAERAASPLTIMEYNHEPPLHDAIQTSTHVPTEANGSDLMTWGKFQPELFARMAADGLSVSAGMGHLSSLGWLYAQEREDCVIPARLGPLGVMPMHDHPDQAAAELVRAGYWATRADGSYELLDHADVLRESLRAQWAKKAKDRRGQQAARDRKSSAASSMTASPTQASELPSNHVRTKEPSPNGLGQCRTCDHREPLGPDGRCRSCAEWDVQEEVR